MSEKKLLLFDFDGTIIDNSEGIFNCIRHAAARVGIPCPDNEALRPFVGPPLYESFTAFLGADHETALKMVDAYRERYRPLGTKEAVLYPKVKEMLAGLKEQGKILAVCSGKPRDFVITISRNLGIAPLFDDYFCPSFSDTHVTKSDYIRTAMEKYGATPAETVMVGDTKSDVTAATEAGVDFAGAAYGFAAPGELEAHGATALAADVPALYKLLGGREDL